MAEVVDNTTSRGRTIRFLFDGPNEELYSRLDVIGDMPMPPYIEREPTEEDKHRYQTVFAKERGAVAAPTAAMHFTEEDRKSTRLNSSHVAISYAVFCLK